METGIINHGGINFNVGYRVHGENMLDTHEVEGQQAYAELISIKVEDSQVELIDWIHSDILKEVEELIQEKYEI